MVLLLTVKVYNKKYAYAGELDLRINTSSDGPHRTPLYTNHNPQWMQFLIT